MERIEIKHKIEEMLEVEEDKYSMDTELQQVKEWDSLAKISFIALADSSFDRLLSGQDLRGCRTMGDLVDLLG